MTTRSLSRAKPRLNRPQKPRPSILLRARVRFLPGEFDSRLVAGADPAGDSALALRAHRLTSARYRDNLALGFEHALQTAADRRIVFSAAVPLRRREVLAARPWLIRLAERLRSAEAVRPEGVVLAERLLTDGSGPLYLAARSEDVQRAARAALDALSEKS